MQLKRPRRHPENPLAGLTVVLPRSADRAAAMVAELRQRGADVELLPLIDFEEPDSTQELDEALVMLGQGRFEWMVVTSITTVRALKQRAARLDRTLPGLVGDTKVAAVGSATARALEAEGITVDLVPEGSMDAVGLVEDWPQGAELRPEMSLRTNVFLPQADIAADTIFEGLMGKGWQVLPVVAYRTVDYPARPERRLTESLASAGPAGQPAEPEPEPLTVDQFKAGLDAGRIDAVVLTSPSIARRLRQVSPELPDGLLLVAIGNSSAAEGQRLGMSIAATAALPTPEGIADALLAAVRNQDRTIGEGAP
ncbi:uroporphyrinogen-III synthase [Arthrobacter crystallopoietes BAB-32]|uniref:Uroporphyrinogen-III synthase n=1 Tax=Arthrobacter crystallopoietes BAB-32 TaxID=1246476 RepID=N1V696_9MICC|nr:uroporphyrinogen-III synthase [Arthrobacter crystallopoietes]EMY35627.1 uroporphyrinogen-III synthase [Arthrobacter crystallopoietes BAB-32]